jgi:hypothetical protein
MFTLTTKSIYSLNKGESVVLSIDDVEYKHKPWNMTQFNCFIKDYYSIIVTKQ